MATFMEFLIWSAPTWIPFLIGAALAAFLTWSRMSAKLDARAREMSRTVREAQPIRHEVPVQRTIRAQPHDTDATVIMNVVRPEDER